MFGTRKTFADKVRESGLDKLPAPLIWFYASFIDKETGKFLGACLVQGERWIRAFDVAWELKPKNGKVEATIEVPDESLPPEEYRNRLLTRAEVEHLWLGREPR